MSDEKKERSESYGRARHAFDDLSMDERASFLVESVVGMMAEGVGQAGRVVSQVLDELGEKLDGMVDAEEADKGPAARKKEPAAKAPSAAKKSTGSRRKKAAPKDKGNQA